MHSITSKFKNIFKVLLTKKSKPAFARDVIADWQKLMISFVLLSFVVMGLCAYFFWKLNGGEYLTAGIKPPETVETLSTKILSDINTYYSAQQEKNLAVTATSSVPIDPSL